MRIFGRMIIAVLAFCVAQPIAAQAAFGQNQVQNLVLNAEETLAAERRVANSALASQRRGIAARDSRIRQLEAELRNSGGAHARLEAQIIQIQRETAADKEALVTVPVCRLADMN